MIIYTASKKDHIAYKMEGNGIAASKTVPVSCTTPTESDLTAIIFGLTEYFNAWNTELDARQFRGEDKVATPSQETQRPLPPPVQVCVSAMALGLLRGTKVTGTRRINTLLKTIKNITKNIIVEYVWVDPFGNPAYKELDKC
jgi:hypothetical protein